LTAEELSTLDKLPVLDSVIKETLRLDSPVSDTIRQAMKDDIIPTTRPYIDAHGIEHDSIPCVSLFWSL
jgi:cytochrome P450